MLGLGLALSVGKRLLGDAIGRLIQKLSIRGTYSENLIDTRNIITDIDDADVLDKATILLTPTATSDARVHSVKTYTGDELVTNGTFDTDSDWTKGTGWSISDGKAISVGGADFASLNQEIGATSGNTYKVIFTITEYTSGQLFLNIQGSSITYTSTGTYTAYVVSGGSKVYFVSGSGLNQFVGSIDNVSVVDVSSDFDFDRASSATRINSSGLVSNVATGVPRINYNSNGDNGHILLEPTSTNLITYSEDFEQWTEEANIDVTNNSIISPDGTQNAAKLQLTGSSSGTDGKISFAVSPSATTHTFSVFAKKGNHDYIYIWMNISGGTNITRWIDLDDGSVNVGSGTATVTTTSFSNDWWKIEYTFDATNLTGVRLEVADDGVSTGTGGDNIYVWGAQLEALPYATSYIPTLTGSTVTRATETLTGSGNSTLINSTEGVLYAEIAALADDGTYRILSLSDGTTNERVYMQYTNASNTVSVVVKDGGVTQANMVYVLSDATNFSKVAIKYKANDFALWVDGVERGTDTSGNTPTGLNTLDFNNASSTVFYGKVKALAVFNEALSDTELTNLTS